MLTCQACHATMCLVRHADRLCSRRRSSTSRGPCELHHDLYGSVTAQPRSGTNYLLWKLLRCLVYPAAQHHVCVTKKQTITRHLPTMRSQMKNWSNDPLLAAGVRPWMRTRPCHTHPLRRLCGLVSVIWVSILRRLTSDLQIILR